MEITMRIVYVLVFALAQISAFPQTPHETSSFVVSRVTRDVQQDKPIGKEESPVDNTGPPKIYEMRVDSNITNRFAHTLVTSKVKNFASNAQETVFSIVLPKQAFISKFVMSIGGKEYDAYVKEKEEAKQIYDQAIASGQSAGLVSANARESNSFTVAVNIEPQSKVTFFLTYEQLLEREDNQYELVINIHPKQPVKDLTVYVNINESQALKFVRTPPIRSGNEINEVEGDLDPRAFISMIGSNSATIKFSPNLERQKEMAKTLGTNIDEGLAGQFVVQYDVERNSSGGEILLNDGYFIHFFAPPGREPLPKYILFVLDTSGSMYGTKISQLKAAMKSILRELKSQDKFHLIEFNTRVEVLNLYEQFAPALYPNEAPPFWRHDDQRPKEDITTRQFPASNNVNIDNIQKAIEKVDALDADGGTNIADALKVALYLVDVDKRNNSDEDAPQPMIIFLTDGDATVGETNSNNIISQVQEENTHSVPIFSLSFGDGADKDLLQKLSLRNSGFSRHIYQAADASLQLQDFYKHISSPVLRNVTFKYVEDAKDLSQTTFPILFEGSELVVVGKIDDDKHLHPVISGSGVHGYENLTPEVKKPVTRLERLWAYKTIQQLLDDMERSDNKTGIKSKALDLALKYSFVTPVSSLVVVKPNATDSPVVPLPADKSPARIGYAQALSASYNKAGIPHRGVHFTASFDSMDVQDRIGPFFMPPRSTTRRPTVPTTIAPIEQLKRELPWLNSALKGDTITTTQGSYKLGLNETSTDNVSCPATPKNGPGQCKLLHECPEVHYLLTNVYIFQQYYCEMRGFAAVCCPNVQST